MTEQTSENFQAFVPQTFLALAIQGWRARYTQSGASEHDSKPLFYRFPRSKHKAYFTKILAGSGEFAKQFGLQSMP